MAYTQGVLTMTATARELGLSVSRAAVSFRLIAVVRGFIFVAPYLGLPTRHIPHAGVKEAAAPST